MVWREMVVYLADFNRNCLRANMPIQSETANLTPRIPAMKRDFAGLQRDADGKLPDDELVKIFTDSVEDLAGTAHYPLPMRHS